MNDPSLWYLNRRTASGAFAVGLFCMYMPPFGQAVMAAAAAIVLRVNLPLSVVLVFVTNPITIPPMFYFAYLVGCWVVGAPAVEFSLEFWTDLHNWVAVLKPLSIGMLICATACSAGGYFGIQALWRWSLRREIKRRKERYRAMAAQAASGTPKGAGISTPSSSRQT